MAQMSLYSDVALCVQNTKQEVVDVVIANGSGILLSLFLENSSHSVPFFFFHLRGDANKDLDTNTFSHSVPVGHIIWYDVFRKYYPRKLFYYMQYITYVSICLLFPLFNPRITLHSCLSIYLSTTWELNRVNFHK